MMRKTFERHTQMSDPVPASTIHTSSQMNVSVHILFDSQIIIQAGGRILFIISFLLFGGSNTSHKINKQTTIKSKQATNSKTTKNQNVVLLLEPELIYETEQKEKSKNTKQNKSPTHHRLYNKTNFFSNIFAAVIIIAASTTTTTASASETASSPHLRCRRGGCGSCSTSYRSSCSQCSGVTEQCQYELCPYYISEQFKQCVCKSGYTEIDGNCAGANGKSCSNDAHCISGTCVDNVCVDLLEEGSSCNDDANCLFGSCINSVCKSYEVIGEEKRCGRVSNAKLLKWNAGTTAACAELVALDSVCSNMFMLKNKNQAIGDEPTEEGTECRCVQNSQSCSLTSGGDWNTFVLVAN